MLVLSNQTILIVQNAKNQHLKNFAADLEPVLAFLLLLVDHSFCFATTSSFNKPKCWPILNF